MTRSHELALVVGMMGLVCLRSTLAVAQVPEPPHDKPVVPATAPQPEHDAPSPPPQPEPAVPAQPPQPPQPAIDEPARQAPEQVATPPVPPNSSEGAASSSSAVGGRGQDVSPSPAAAAAASADAESATPGPASAPRSKRRRPPGTGKSSWSHTLEHPFHEFGPDLRRHVGFSLRVGAGLGFGSAHRKHASTVSGLEGSLHVDIGTTVLENLVVYGRLEGFAFNHLPSHDPSDAGNAYFGLVGAGARYYFMPIDWYAGGTLSLAGVLITSDHDAPDENAHPGFGLSVETGKNWWAGSRRDLRAVGLGLRGSYVWASPAGKSSKDDHPWVGLALCVVFSVAYN